MSLSYGLVKARATSNGWLKPKPAPNEVQYHEHFSVEVDGAKWDIAVNVGTTDSDDLLRFRLIYDIHGAVAQALEAAPAGKTDLTGTQGPPALDYASGGLLDGTGPWRDSDPMDGSEYPEPAASLRRLIDDAFKNQWDVVVLGRFYPEGFGMHDVHMNQGSRGRFFHRPGDDRNDHNDRWQDGALFAKRGALGWAAYFAMFMKQSLDNDALGNPK